jgi:ribosomal protein L40E
LLLLLGKLRGLMDTDLFQGVLLGLLAVGLIVLIALLATLGGIRKALEQRAGEAPGRSDEPTDTAAESEPETSPTNAETASEPEPSPRTAEAAPDESTGYTGAGSYATPISGGASATDTGQAASIRSVLQDHGVAAAESSPAEEPAPSEEPAVDSAFAAHADDPQEEPFQRDGRWWFRRGGELLLFDESSGQWQPAPDDASATPAPVAATDTADTGAGTAATTGGAASTESMPAVADQVATFWKCPTCGAVNGSTAATCRMCFAARP